MNKREAKEFIQKYLTDFLEKHGFTEKKRRDNEVTFRRKTKDGFDGIGLGTVSYTPVQIIQYSVYKQIDSVENIMADIGNKLGDRKSFPDMKELYTVAFGYEGYHGMVTKSRYLPEMQNEAEAKVAVDMIIDFMQKDAIPQLDKFNDLREIDKIINGDDFWITDWQKPFNLGGGNFCAKRLVVAKLAGNPKYDEVVRKNYEGLREFLRGVGNQKELDELNESDLSQPIPFAVEYLKNVESMY